MQKATQKVAFFIQKNYTPFKIENILSKNTENSKISFLIYFNKID